MSEDGRQGRTQAGAGIERVSRRLAVGIEGKGKGDRFLKEDQDAECPDEEAIARGRKVDCLYGV